MCECCFTREFPKSITMSGTIEGEKQPKRKEKKQRGVVLINGFEQLGALNQSKKPVEVLV